MSAMQINLEPAVLPYLLHLLRQRRDKISAYSGERAFLDASEKWVREHLQERGDDFVNLNDMLPVDDEQQIG